MNRKMTVLVAGVMLTTMLAGCGTKSTHNVHNNSVTDKGVKVLETDKTKILGTDGVHNNNWNNTTYNGVRNNSTTPNGVHNYGWNGTNTNGVHNYNNTTGTKDYGHGTGYGTTGYGYRDGYGTGYGNTGYGNTGYDYGTTGNGTHSFHSLKSEQRVADKISQLPGVKSSYVMLGDSNAYVAVTLQDEYTAESVNHHLNNHRYKSYSTSNPSTSGTEVSEQLKTKIAQVVREDTPNVKNVYVSANPDFVGRVTNYAADVKAGRPINGFVSQFSEIVNRIFPTNAAKNMNEKSYTHNVHTVK